MAEASVSSEGSVPELKEVRLFLAGKTGAGKSTLIKNFFDIQHDYEISATPITTKSETMVCPIENHGIKVLLTDTVGLLVGTKEDGNEREKEVKKLKEHFKLMKKRPHLLLYCIPIDPSSKFVDSNPVIMETLQKNFGKEIWKQCKVIFTFSNLVWDQLKKKSKGNVSDAFLKYKAHLNKYASLFEEELRKLGVHDVIVRTTFAKDQTTTEGQGKIVALPAGDDEDDEVFAGISSSHKVGDEIDIQWKDAVFIEIARSCNKELEESLMFFKYGKKAFAIATRITGLHTGAVVGGVTGIAAGGYIGAAIGSAFGPPGIIIGGGLGELIAGLSAGHMGALVGNKAGKTFGETVTGYKEDEN